MWIVWGHGTALLLPRYLRGRHSGPLFCSERRPGSDRRSATAKRDICPETGRIRLGYDRARTLIKHYTSLHLHQLRHSAATHLGESGEDSSVIMAKTHHRSIRTTDRYTKPGSPPSPKPPNASTHHTAEADQPEPPPPVFPGLPAAIPS